MRLIDADALWDELGILYHHNNGKVNWNDAILEIKNAPTIEERKTGRWKHGREVCRDYVGTAIVAIHYEHWECSECGYRPDGEPKGGHFCPNCGAKMEDCET